MRVVAAWILAVGLIALPLMAGTNSTKDDSSSAAKSDTAANAKASAPANTAKTESTTKTESASMEAELEQLRDLLEMQAKQLQEQNRQLQEQQKKMQLLEEQLNATMPGRAASMSAASTSAVPADSSSSVAPSPDAITKNVANNVTNSGASKPAQAAKPDEPAALHYKGITLTPGGFTAAETVYRSKALSADVNTPFNSAPMPGASNGNVSEFNASGRQSRISMLMEGKLSDVKIGGYYEGDFLGAGSPSNNNQSNSYVFRQRQFWGQAAFDNGWTITGGQQWSLLTQTAKGMDNRTEVLPMTIDAQYHVGFSWARQYGFRFTKNFGNKFWLGLALEGPQTTFTVHGNPTTTVTTGTTTVSCPVPGTGGCSATGTVSVGGTSTVYTNFLLGASGAGGGLFNPLANYSYNPSPDLVFKAVAEPAPWAHFEVFGVYERFRDRVFPCEVGVSATSPCPVDQSTTPSAVGAFNDSRNGGGGGANMMLNLLAKHVDLGFHIFGGSGIGRYGSGGLSDATIRPDGTIALLREYQSLGTLVLHPTPKLDIYLNGGGEFASRAAYLNGTKGEGYGSPLFSNAGCYTEISPTTSTPVGTAAGSGYIPGSLSNCTGDTRNQIEGTLGFWYRFYQGPKGRLQYGMQYSYYVRNTWAGTPASNGVSTPSSVENMAFTSLRYYLP